MLIFLFSPLLIIIKNAATRACAPVVGQSGVSFEAYQISNQAFGWAQDGTLQPLSNDQGGGAGESAAVRTTKTVVAEGKETMEVCREQPPLGFSRLSSRLKNTKKRMSRCTQGAKSLFHSI